MNKEYNWHKNVDNWLKRNNGGEVTGETIGGKMKDEGIVGVKIEGRYSLLYTIDQKTRTE